MIFDHISHAKQYAGLHAGVDKMLETVKEYTSENFSDSRVVLDGDKLFMNFFQYETHAPETAQLEAHKKYIDVMYMVEGSETIYVKNTEQIQTITKEYTPEMEALLGKMDPDVAAIRLAAGSFVVLFPQDAHAPGCHADEAAPVKKIVGKVLL